MTILAPDHDAQRNRLEELAGLAHEIELSLDQARRWVDELSDSVDELATRAADAEHALKSCSSRMFELEDIVRRRR
jgi:hypothetical protein